MPKVSKLFEDPKCYHAYTSCARLVLRAFCPTGSVKSAVLFVRRTPFIIPQDDVSKLLTAFFVADMIYATELLKQEGKGCGSCGSMTTTCAAVAAAFFVDCASFLCMDNHLLMKVLKDHKVLEIKKS